MLIEDVDIKGYTHQASLDLYFKSPASWPNGVMFNAITTTKPKIDSLELGVYRRVVDKAIHIVISKADCDTMLDNYKKVYKKAFRPRKLSAITYDEVVNMVFGANVCKDYGICDWRAKDVLELDGTLTTGIWHADFIIFKMSDFHEVEYTEAENKWLAANSIKETKAKFNKLVLGDILVNELNKKENDYTISIHENRYLYCDRPRGWNKLIKDAVEYYLNNIVLKDTGCKIFMPKHPSTHKHCFKDPICDLGEVVAEFEQEAK